MLSKKIFLLFVTSILINGCGSVPSLDEVLPDNRTKYQRSQPLPDLEVPPDLTSETTSDPLVIPGEEDAATLSKFQRRKLRRQDGQLSDAEMALLGNADEKWLVVQGTTSSVWPKLREFWIAKGFEMDLDDAELGVMETQHKAVSVDGVVTYREKFKIFSEEGDAPGKLILFLSSEMQANISGSGGNVDWISQESSDDQEKELIRELNMHLHGATTSPASKQLASSRKSVTMAEILNIAEGKEYLTIPDEFFKAWRNIEGAISESGMYIEKKDMEKGIYTVTYYADATEEKAGLLSKLKFWGDDDEDGKEFHISMTGVGDKTEVVVLDDEDKWAENSDASHILSMLQSHYNKLLRGRPIN